MFGRATDGYVSLCGTLIRKAAFSMLLLLGVAVGAGWFGSRLPQSFLPDEDQGYVFAGLQLPMPPRSSATTTPHERLKT